MYLEDTALTCTTSSKYIIYVYVWLLVTELINILQRSSMTMHGAWFMLSAIMLKATSKEDH